MIHGNERQHEASLRDVTLAGFSAGVVSSVIVSPTELIKVRLQTESSSSRNHHHHHHHHHRHHHQQQQNHKTQGRQLKQACTTRLGMMGETFECVKQIVKEGGMKNLFRGYYQTLFRESLSYACYFGSYEAMLRSITPKGEQPSTMGILLAGSVSGLVVWGPVYPIDVVKTRIQACTNSTPDCSMKCVQKILAKEGVRGFFKGFATTMVRAVPVNAITFLVFEQVQKSLPQ